jgi:GT2 family glycosyltransferase
MRDDLSINGAEEDAAESDDLLQRGHVGITVVVTVRNDRDELAELLNELPSQTRMPDEVVIVDGGSDDGTRALLEETRRSGVLPLTVIDAPGSNISAGRNIGVRAASHELLACTDAGCRPNPGWLAAIVNGLSAADFVGGTYRIDARTPFERCLAVALYPSPEEVRRPNLLLTLSHRLFGRAFEVGLTTGRSMGFTRSAWATAGGFREELFAGEDVAFSSTMIASGLRTVLIPAAEVSWRPRETWRGNAAMYRAYARGDVRRGRRGRHAVRMLAWSTAPTLAITGPRAARALVAVSAVAYLGLPASRAVRVGLPAREWWRLPLLIAMKDLAQCIGGAQGLGDAARGRPQPRPLRP